MRRLFAAIMLPDAAREHLVTALRPLRGRELRWTDPDNWHLTLGFYGDQPNDAGRVTDALAQATAFRRPLALHLQGAGSFSSRTLWVGVGGETQQLRDLMADCLLGPAERHCQRAHLTVARGRDGWLIADHAHALSVYRGPDFTADEVALVESHLGEGRGGGSRYEVVDRFYLR
ncbi:RNA 2',3'-cyclic phosphodiesterase [Corynebacterium timonense]|uniref:RNA 2',3'-cyclic phosphodiesterase n=1 Tax=Corynebacterium timonense TaxID=441500 RepID=A0A1H1TW89_9CORY|nr:RNA 2',3'-cyclic phosphodiesterase [Corynebacterium timonense]SDS64507.1 2'-5' RNA ligase [Corynebacterium timonense]